MSSTYDPQRPDPSKQPVYIPVPMQPRPGPIARLFQFLQWIAVGFIVLAIISLYLNPQALQTDDNNLTEKYHSLSKDGTTKVAIIEVEGAIIDGDTVKKQIDKVRADTNVKAVVLRVDSPGGTVTASDYIYTHLRKLTDERKLPLVVSMGGLAASGGYYVSMACGDSEDVIYAEPTTWTGSIGVIIPHYNVAGLMKKLEIQDDSIKRGELKGVGSFTREMKPEEKAVLESLVDESYARFKDIVRSGRPKLRKDEETLTKATTGQVFTTKQAMKLGLVDKEGFIEDAINRAIELAHLNAATTKVVRYQRPKTFVDALVGARAATPSIEMELQKLLDSATPRAYYLFAFPMPEALR